MLPHTCVTLRDATRRRASTQQRFTFSLAIVKTSETFREDDKVDVGFYSVFVCSDACTYRPVSLQVVIRCVCEVAFVAIKYL